MRAQQSGLQFYSVPPQGRPQNHYEMSYPLPPSLPGFVLYVADSAPSCPDPVQGVLPFNTEGGAYAKQTVVGYVVKASCIAP